MRVPRVHIVQQVDDQLQGLSDEGREQKPTEGDDLEQDEPPHHVAGGGARGPVAGPTGSGVREGEADEDGYREEGVDVRDAI